MEVYNMAYAYNGSYISNITFNDGNVKQIINNANLESQDGFVFYAIDYQNNKDIDLMAYYLPTKGEGNHPYKWTISVKDIYSDGDEKSYFVDDVGECDYPYGFYRIDVISKYPGSLIHFTATNILLSSNIPRFKNGDNESIKKILRYRRY